MGLRLNASIDTSLGSTDKLYVRIDNINVNRVHRTVKVAVTYWLNQEIADSSRKENYRNSKGLIANTVILYRNPGDIGEEIELPTHFEFRMASPKKVEIPVYEETIVPVEVPYVGFDDLGRRIIRYKTVNNVEKVQIGTREDYTQVLDLDLETSLVSWCYGQVKAELDGVLPVELLENC